jgi:phosphoribosylglycinamide formyltransferase-1
MARLRVAVLISGRGSNLKALIEACTAADFPAEIVLVLANRAAPGLAYAQSAGIAHEVVPHRDFPDRAAFDAALDERLNRAGVELICLAGFMRLFSPDFVASWLNRLINIHPSLLPLFPGLHPQQQALDAGVRFSGCTVHFLRHATDTGPIIVQAAVPVLPDDDSERLAERILAAEHRVYPLALRLIAEGRARVVGERVEIAGASDWPHGAFLINPPS